MGFLEAGNSLLNLTISPDFSTFFLAETMASRLTVAEKFAVNFIDIITGQDTQLGKAFHTVVGLDVDGTF